MTKRLLLIDGHSMAYRAFFALPAENFTTASGQHTNAIYGFATMLISLLKEEKPTHIAVAFDVSRKTFRTEIFPDYKANRAKTPDEFRSQMSYLHELVASFGINSHAKVSKPMTSSQLLQSKPKLMALKSPSVPAIVTASN